MPINGVLTTGPAVFNPESAAFGSAGRASGIFTIAGAESIGMSGSSYTDGTMEAWVKTTSSGTQVAVGANQGHWVGSVGGKATASIGSNFWDTTVAINDDAWHHLALVWIAGKPRFFVDGNLEKTSETPVTGTPQSATIGNLGGSGFPWTGAIDEVRFSTVARYSANFTRPILSFSNDANTGAKYHLDGDANDTAGSTTSDGLTGPAAGLAPTTIDPDDPGIVYSPYNWDVSNVRAMSTNPGAYFKTLIDGDPASIALTFDVSGASPDTKLAIRVDQGGWQYEDLAALVPVDIPDNPWTKHHLEVVLRATLVDGGQRWFAPTNCVKLTGIVVSAADGATATAVTPRGLNILAFGDSITEGVKTLGADPFTDSIQGYAWRLTETLGAEVGVVGYGRQGLAIDGQGNVPAFGITWPSLFNGVARDFDTSPPDLIVINQGTNDSGDITAPYTAVLNAMLAAIPETTQIAVMRPLGGYHAAQIQAARAACTDPSRVTYIDTTGWWDPTDSSDGLHPYGYTNVARTSPLLADALRPLLPGGGGASNLFLITDDGEVPIGSALL